MGECLNLHRMDALFGTRWWSWQRIVCLALTLAIVAFLFRRIDVDALVTVLGDASLGWFAMAFALYGLTLTVGGLRWHVTLHAIRCAVHVGASIRSAFIGHFFFLVLFGAATGDVAKAALYARWYRFGAPELTAATPIDRALGVSAAVTVGVLAGLVGLAFGGFERLSFPAFQTPAFLWWAAAAAMVATILALVLWKPAGESWWARGWRTLRGGLHELLCSRRKLAAGAGTAILAQLMMSSVLALNLRAVAGEPLPWLQLAWTFPVIMLLSCVPVTVAGAGVREWLSITFLGLYGMPAGECVAAAMLTFVCKVAWAGVGGAVLWREASVQKRFATTPEPSRVSVIIPTLNERDALPRTVEHLRRNDGIAEIIVVDGGSTDRTPEIAEQLGCRVLSSRSGRGVQMRAGAEVAHGDVILLLHADTWLPPHATRALLDCLRDRTVVAGGFWKEFRHSPLLLLGSKWKCAVRLWAGRRIAGDQAMFVRRAALEQIGGIPPLALMEEFALCSRLRRIGRLALAEAVVLTSARRFRKLGVIRTYLRMWRVATQYRLGTKPAELRKLYDQGQ